MTMSTSETRIRDYQTGVGHEGEEMEQSETCYEMT